MNAAGQLSDHDHPAIRTKAEELTVNSVTRLEKLDRIFHFVRDEIPFGFPPKSDSVRASETLQYKVGYCNTKATLFLALCKAADIPARIHTGLIDIAIMHGVMPSFAFPFLPGAGDHAWMEVEIGGDWKPIDSYINDKPFYKGALRRLQVSGRVMGFSISRASRESSCEFNFGEKGFVHMGGSRRGSWDVGRLL